jgi:hypothetical protein
MQTLRRSICRQRCWRTGALRCTHRGSRSRLSATLLFFFLPFVRPPTNPFFSKFVSFCMLLYVKYHFRPRCAPIFRPPTDEVPKTRFFYIYIYKYFIYIFFVDMCRYPVEVCASERALLSFVIAAVHRLDPDVIAGHNVLACVELWGYLQCIYMGYI